MLHWVFSFPSNIFFLKISARLGHLGGSMIECLPSTQVAIPGSWGWVPYPAACRESASPSAYVSASLSLCLSWINKLIKYLKKISARFTPENGVELLLPTGVPPSFSSLGTVCQVTRVKGLVIGQSPHPLKSCTMPSKWASASAAHSWIFMLSHVCHRSA